MTEVSLSMDAFTVEDPKDRAAIRAAYDAHGVVLVRDAIDLDQLAAFRDAFAAMIAAAMEETAIEGRGDELDALYLALTEAKPDTARAVKGMGKDLVEYHRLMADPNLTAVVAALFGHARFQINYDQCLFRIDRPHEDLAAFGWHQDYPYNVMSQSAVTGWIPLTPVTAEMGYLRLIPRSHDRIYPVVFKSEHTGASFQKHNTIEMADLETLAPDFETAGLELGPIHPGDAAFFHSCIVHRSGPNRSAVSRWVMNPRYGDLIDPIMIARNWRTARAKYPLVFNEIHPEMVVSGGDLDMF